MNNKRLYECTGENYGYKVRMGCCGMALSLVEWLQVLTGRSANFLYEYFDGFPDAEVVEYIYTNYGKRLSQRPNRNGQKG